MQEKLFNREMLTVARESRGQTQTQIAQQLSLTPSLISKFESGIVAPTPDNLERLAAALDYPVDLFYQRDQIFGLGCSFLFHRKRKTMPVPEQRRLLAMLNVTRMQIERLLRGAEMEAENSFHAMDPEQHGTATAIAQKLRAAWRLPPGPVANLTASVESAGGLVVCHPFDNDKASGMSWWLPNLPPMFFMNSTLPGDHQRFTLAHEIAHVVMHRVPHERIEEEADEFAAEFLMPASQIASQLGDLTLERAAGLKAYWRTSMQAIIRRARDLKRISLDKYDRLSAQIGAAGYRRNEPLPIPAEQPTLLLDLVRLHIDQHGYDIDQLCELSLLKNVNEFRARYLPDDRPTMRMAN